MTKTALGDENGDFLAGSSWFERDYRFFKKFDLLINDSNRIDEKELLEQRKKFFSVTLSSDRENISKNLRLFKKTSFLSIIKRDIDSKATLEENLSSLSYLAEICIQTALVDSMKYHAKELNMIPESHRRKSELFIIAMGKLGGRELNASSDIDIIFFSPYKDELGSSATTLAKFEKFWDKVLARFINNLSTITDHGFVYRVDMRLRPYGGAGPKIVSLKSLNSYFLKTASDWERYAWVKARVCTEHILLDRITFGRHKHELENVINNFLFRPFADFRIVKSLREMSRKIISNNKNRRIMQGFSFDLKKDFGGIRTVEFIVQYFQLLKGGYHRKLQTPSLRVALREIERNKLIEHKDCADLLDAYTLFRRLENLIQYQEDRQTHMFTGDLLCLNSFLKILDFNTFEALKSHLSQHVEKVKSIYEKIFSDNPNLYNKGEVSLVGKPEVNVRELRLKNEGGEDLYLRKLYEKVQGRSSYISLLAEKPEIEQKLVRLNETSPWIGDFVIQYPKLIDQMLNNNFYNEEINLDELTEETKDEIKRIHRTSSSDIEQSLNVIRDVYHLNLFKILTGGLKNRESIVQISNNLTSLTEVILNITFDFSLQASKMEWLKDELAIIAYGKLGTKEMDIGSDLDLIFLTNKINAVNQENIYRLIKRFISWIELRTFSGSLFKIDTALRPNGATGLLVSSIDSFKDYQKNKAWCWEHQALTKARFLLGSNLINKKFNDLRSEVLMQHRSSKSLQEEVLSMRFLMKEKRKKARKHDLVDVKHDKGGLIDIEFIVQYVILANASMYPKLCENIGNFALLGTIAELQLLPASLARKISEIFVRYRELIHKNRLNNSDGLVKAEILAGEREKVNELWEITFQNCPKKIRPLSQIHSKLQ